MLPLHHDPKCRSGVFVSIVIASSSCSSFPVVALRVELSATRLSAECGQPALDYHVSTSLSHPSSRDGRTRTCVSVLPRPPCTCPVGSPLPYIPLCFQSERPDLNRRSPGPRPGAIPAFATFCSQWPVRESNPSSRLEKPMSLPIDERAISAHIFHAVDSWSCAHLSRSGSGGARIRVSWSSGQPLHHLSYRPNNKKSPMSL